MDKATDSGEEDAKRRIRNAAKRQQAEQIDPPVAVP